MAYTRQKTWTDNNGQQVDAAWLNTVEQQLVDGFGIVPATNGALVWDGAKFTAAALLTNANIDPAAAIDYSKLNVPDAAIAQAKVNGLVAALAAAALGPAPSTTLPGSPTDKQIAVLTDNVATPTYFWVMQYFQSLSKWIFLGGSPAHISTVAADTLSSTTFTDLATVGPSFTTPGAGTWEVSLTCGHIQNSGTDDFRVGISVGGGGATEIAWSNATANASNGQSCSGMARFATSGAQVIKMQYRTRAGGTHTAYNREMKVSPVMIG